MRDCFSLARERIRQQNEQPSRLGLCRAQKPTVAHVKLYANLGADTNSICRARTLVSVTVCHFHFALLVTLKSIDTSSKRGLMMITSQD